MKHLILSVTLSALAGMVSAATFSAGGGQGTSTIGPDVGDDYPSLAAAALDFSSHPGGSTGDWTLLINTPTLTEPNNVAFGNDTGIHQIVVKPAPGVDATITFTTTTVNGTGTFPGNWIIGTSATTNPFDNLTTTSNFTIDGSNNGTDSRNLTIQNTPFTGEAALIRIVGGCENTTIKNAKLISNASSLNFNVEFTCRRNTPTGPSFIPVGCQVENCELTLPTGSNAQNILFRQVSGALSNVPLGSGIDDVVITSNTINANRQCINLGFVRSALIEDNILSLTLPLASGNTPSGISHGANGTTGWTIDINRNKFVNWVNESTAATPRGLGTMLTLGGGIAPPLTGTYNVTNNFFAGFDYNTNVTAGGTASSAMYRGITLTNSSTTCTATFNILHNSFSMPNVPELTSSRVDLYYAIGYVGNIFEGAVTVKNNIFRQEQGNGVVYYRNADAGQTGAFTSDYNVFYLANGSQMASYGNGTTTPNYSGLTAWKSAGYDTNSRIQNPLQPAASGLGKWTSETDLHFDGDPSSIYRGTPAGVAANIDGESRDSLTPVIGANERTITAVVTPADDWSLFQ